MLPKDTSRAFIGCRLDDPGQARLAEVAPSVRRDLGAWRVSWTKPEALHATIQFPGPVESSRLPALGEAPVPAAAAPAPIPRATDRPRKLRAPPPPALPRRLARS